MLKVVNSRVHRLTHALALATDTLTGNGHLQPVRLPWLAINDRFVNTVWQQPGRHTAWLSGCSARRCGSTQAQGVAGHFESKSGSTDQGLQFVQPRYAWTRKHQSRAPVTASARHLADQTPASMDECPLPRGLHATTAVARHKARAAAPAHGHAARPVPSSGKTASVVKSDYRFLRWHAGPRLNSVWAGSAPSATGLRPIGGPNRGQSQTP
jgi:hypothetical protein